MFKTTSQTSTLGPSRKQDALRKINSQVRECDFYQIYFVLLSRVENYNLQYLSIASEIIIKHNMPLQ